MLSHQKIKFLFGTITKLANFNMTPEQAKIVTVDLPVNFLTTLPLNEVVYIRCELNTLPKLDAFLKENTEDYWYIVVDGVPIEEWWSADSKTIHLHCTIGQYLKIFANDFRMVDEDV